ALEMKPAPQRHLSVFALREDERNVERVRDGVADDHTAEGRRNDFGGRQRTNARGQLAADAFRIARVLEQQRALDVVTAVQTRGEAEVTVEQSARLAEHRLKIERHAGRE